MIHIGNRTISSEGPCFVIAEAGVNHNGDLHLAHQLIDAAYTAGADAVKFQTFTAENLVTKSATMAAYQQANTGYNKSQYEMLKSLELGQEDFLKLKTYTERKGLVFISTPFDDQAFELLESIQVKLYKVGSGDLTNLPFLVKIAQSGKPMIISTGMADMEEIHEAVNCIRNGGQQPVILHCTSNYPTADEEVNLSAMRQIQDETNCLVGYSDHTSSLEVPALAVAMGARVIEKHLTLSREMPGPDHMASVEPKAFRELINKIRWVETIMGSGVKMPAESEKDTALVARKSLVALEEIKAGELIGREKLGIKRPGSGVKPKYLEEFIGKIARRDIGADELITWEDVA